MSSTSLLGPLPQARAPELSVDGTVQIERLADVVFMGRPVFGQPDYQLACSRSMRMARAPARVNVKLGRASVNTIEVLDGLKVGDRVILSDMSQWDSHKRIRLN